MLNLLHKIIGALSAMQARCVQAGITQAYNQHAKADAHFKRSIEEAQSIADIAQAIRNRAVDDLAAKVEVADAHLTQLYRAKGEEYTGMIYTAQGPL